MTDVQTSPSFNPDDLQSFSGIMNVYKQRLFNSLECCIPAVVVSYDRSKNIVTVTPAVNMALAGGQYLQRENIQVTCWTYGGGGYFLNIPLQAGDTGWIIASDKDSSLFKQSRKVENPNTNIKHSYLHGFFMPDKINGFAVSSDDSANLVIVSTGGEKISIGQSATKIMSANLTIECPTVTITGDVNIGGSTAITGTMHSANYDAHTHVSGAEGSPTGAPDQ